MGNLDQTGFHIVGKFGGELIQTDQTSLPLNDPGKEEKRKAAAQQIVANLAPAADDIAAIKDVLAKKVVENVEYDEATGLYVITTGPGEGKKGKRHQVKFTNGTVSPVVPPKKAPKKDDAPEPKATTDYATEPGTGLAMTDESYAKLVGLAAARKKPHNYFHTIALLMLDVDATNNDDFGNNIDRWKWGAGVGMDDKHLLTHIGESLGGKAGRSQKVGDFTHHLYGAKKKPGIVFCSDLADDKLPKWCEIDDRELFHGPNGDLLKIVRDVLHIPQPIVI